MIIRRFVISFIITEKYYFFYKNILREIKNYSNLAPLNIEL